MWNVGKERYKDPQAIHGGVYKSCTFSSSRIIAWNPRPTELGGKVGMQEINAFLKDLRETSSKRNLVAMWEFSVHQMYEEYALESLRFHYTDSYSYVEA